MNEINQRFWPFKPQVSSVAAISALVIVLAILSIFPGTVAWAEKESRTTILVLVLLLSSLPILLALVDVVVERGAKIRYAGVEIELSKVPQFGGGSAFTVPVNIGLRAQSVTESATEIIDTLEKSTSCDVVIVDLESGQAWWETRLLVLLAGAVRLKKPDKLVFVGRDSGTDRSFQGWSHPYELLPHLLEAHPQYSLSYYKALAAARQWELVGPMGAGKVPAQPAWVQTGLATNPSMAFNPTDGLPNEFLAEQLLQSDLGTEVEATGQPNSMSLVRLEQLFRPVLHKENIDQAWSSERQMNAFFDGKEEYIAITNNSQYTTLVARLAVLNTMFRKFVQKDRPDSLNHG
jgi:hypothetical protein